MAWKLTTIMYTYIILVTHVKKCIVAEDLSVILVITGRLILVTFASRKILNKIGSLFIFSVLSGIVMIGIGHYFNKTGKPNYIPYFVLM